MKILRIGNKQFLEMGELFTDFINEDYIPIIGDIGLGGGGFHISLIELSTGKEITLLENKEGRMIEDKGFTGEYSIVDTVFDQQTNTVSFVINFIVYDLTEPRPYDTHIITKNYNFKIPE
jgi:hypothetical protein